MRNCLFILSIILVTNLIACSSTKNMNNDAMFNGAWELEYISGPRIAFNGLYPNKKPRISFDKENSKAQGTNSCNGYSADFSLDGNNISFGQPGSSTLMYCGEGEKVFLNMMQKIDTYEIDSDGKLVLKSNDVALMRFHNVPKP
ncbi:META domain-containing protein [Maribacter litopenaei]|uniref:META domain-containing protein n=1 Tax=Maribacter litopenaei TaxID=2976127 RepID=A0ABY5YBM7_9FLAO|nr:META domain-containing protein [Maribacter litopenaei]UWX56329.1 META domain-containing protein [Maribacter litopenaei]